MERKATDLFAVGDELASSAFTLPRHLELESLSVSLLGWLNSIYDQGL